MANRLSKITTRTGDDGSTGLGDGSRVSKSAPRIQVLGDLDELNSSLGVLLTCGMNIAHRSVLSRVQNQLFDLGGEVSIPTHRALKAEHLEMLDEASSALNAGLTPLKEFILPGGSLSAAHAHLARTVARRAERSLVALAAIEPVSELALQYLNRLSDYLFILARTLNKDVGVADVCWHHG